MANSNQTSFQQEFNRLSFLASIATGTSPANKASFQNSSDDISRGTNNAIGNKSIEANSASNNSFLVDSSANDMCASDIGRINSLLINANEQADLLKTQTNIKRQPPTILRNRTNHSAKTPVNSSRMLSPLLPATNGTLQNLHLKKASQIVSNISSISQQPSLQSTSSSSSMVLNQISSAKTNFGQTVILPANLAGVSGKVLIVNNLNKPPQTVSQKLSSQDVIQNNIQHKPVILIPSSTDQQHAQQVQSNRLPLIVNSNLIKNNQLPALQHIQPISMNSFQSIRPKSFVQSIRPKMEIVSSTSCVNSQGIRLSHFPISSSVTINPSSVVVCNPLQNTLIEASSNSSLKTFTVSVLPSAFDKAMSEHLQTLEKIEPHLFTLNKGLLMNQGSSHLNEDQMKQHILQSTNQLHVVTSTISSLQNSISKEHNQTTQSALQQPNTNVMISPIKQSSNTVLKQNENLQNVIRQQQLKQLQEQHTAIIKNQVQQQALEQAKQQQNELFVLQQQLIQQVENQKHMQQKQQRFISNTINQPGLQAKLQIQPQNINLLQTSQQKAPLKLLSSLTNMVNKSVAPSTVTNGRLLTNNSNDQFFLINPSVSMQNVRPVLVQLPGGNTVLSTQLVNASQLSSAQLAELQKSLLIQQSKLIQPIVSQQQNVIISSSNQNSSIKSNSVLNFNLVSSSSIFTPQTVLVSSSKTLAGQNIIQKSASTSQSSVNFNDKTTDISNLFNKQLSNLSSIQKDQLLKQLGMAGLGNAQLQKTSLSNTMLISSILKNSTTGTAQEEQKQLLAQQVKKTNTMTNKIRSVKRSAPIEVATQQEHRLTKKWKHVLTEDQTHVVSPDIKHPFKSLNDAVTRLVPYHVFSSNDESCKKDSLKFDILFECYARNVLERKTWLLNKFNRIMFDEDLIISPSEEAIQIARLFNSNEIENLAEQKSALQEGRSTIVVNENGSLYCVAVEEQSSIELQNKKSFSKVMLQSSEQQPFEERLRVAHKDISRINFEEFDGSDEEDELEEQDEEEEIQIREFDCYKDGTFKMEDIELTAATDNLLADLQQQDDYNMRFEL
ncbi:protein split ends [Hydra vulgaris]|uniref:Uncharacterized protein KIAA0240 n=1 Tax=Hydra vulgaris TaxID=6087 RepID=T2MBM8_HYDVU|nr:protein split ends [Hydra vulgaris]XP_012558441.1 protein split ends [Hydra vulgaris]